MPTADPSCELFTAEHLIGAYLVSDLLPPAHDPPTLRCAGGLGVMPAEHFEREIRAIRTYVVNPHLGSHRGVVTVDNRTLMTDEMLCRTTLVEISRIIPARVCSSTIETILTGRPSTVASNWKSTAHTRFGAYAVPLVAVVVPRRFRGSGHLHWYPFPERAQWNWSTARPRRCCSPSCHATPRQTLIDWPHHRSRPARAHP